jgi:hypothetical protein
MPLNASSAEPSSGFTDKQPMLRAGCLSLYTTAVRFWAEVAWKVAFDPAKRAV